MCGTVTLHPKLANAPLLLVDSSKDIDKHLWMPHSFIVQIWACLSCSRSKENLHFANAKTKVQISYQQADQRPCFSPPSLISLVSKNKNFKRPTRFRGRTD